MIARASVVEFICAITVPRPSTFQARFLLKNSALADDCPLLALSF